MQILITKDGSTKIPREVADLAEAHQIASTGFHVELLGEDGKGSPLPALEDPVAGEAAGASEDTAAEAAAPAKKAAAKKAR